MTRSRHRWGSAAVTFTLAAVTFTFAASAHARDGADDDDDGALGTHQKHVRLDIGARGQYIASEGLDPFNEQDYVPHVYLGASYVLWTRDKLSVAGALGFDYGASSAEARSSDASLSLLRFSLGPEVRYHLLRVLALTARLSPTITREKAELSTGLATDLRDVSWKVGFDATAGVAFEVYGYASGKARRPRFWLTADGGYGFAAANEMVLSAKDSGSAPERSTPVTLPDLSASGPLFKVGAAISF